MIEGGCVEGSGDTSKRPPGVRTGSRRPPGRPESSQNVALVYFNVEKALWYFNVEIQIRNSLQALSCCISTSKFKSANVLQALLGCGLVPGGPQKSRPGLRRRRRRPGPSALAGRPPGSTPFCRPFVRLPLQPFRVTFQNFNSI